MNLLTRQELKRLARPQDGPCLSLYAPMIRSGQETQQNAIQWKNQVTQAEIRLTENGYRRADAERWLEPAYDLIDDGLFWREQSDGLAAFVQPGFFAYYRLPMRFEPNVFVNDHFVTSPILPLLLSNGHFYVLALSQKQIRLLSGNKFRVEPVHLRHVPENLAAALWYDHPEKSIQHHTARPAPTGSGRPVSPMFHGQGLPSDYEKDQILRYSRKIDDGLKHVLREEDAPMVLAAVDSLGNIYRQVNTYDNLLEQGIDGNPDIVSDEDLHGKAWEIVEPYFRRQMEDEAARYREFAGTGRTSNDLPQIIQEAVRGRVATLFMQRDEHRWGHVDLDNLQVDILPERTNDAEELLDRAATETLLKSGTVYALKPDEMPEGSPAVAVFRY